MEHTEHTEGKEFASVCSVSSMMRSFSYVKPSASVRWMLAPLRQSNQIGLMWEAFDARFTMLRMQ